MSSFREKVEQIITGNTADVPFLTGATLSALSKGYAAAVRTVKFCHDSGIFRKKRLTCPVFSIGNITAGGTGKTPMTIYMAALLKELDYSVAILSRGYGGRAEKKGAIVTDGKNILITPDAAGDEPYMMAVRLSGVPVIVGQSRFDAGMLAIKKFNPDIILLDDGFQHRKLFRNLDIVLMDAGHPFGNGHMLPRGALREPASSLDRAGAIVLTRSEDNNSAVKQIHKHVSHNIEVFKSFHKPRACFIVKRGLSEEVQASFDSEVEPFHFLRDKTVFVFSGIAKNSDFVDMITGFGCNISGKKLFSDHYRYSEKDLTDILTAAKKTGAETIITTEKDFARVVGRTDWPIELFVIGIDIEMKADTEKFKNFISKKVKEL
ncbi:MAG: tetraacyldisaccharide 4'-kinase [Desulfobacterales bacterium]|nr:tetraacyldisaccharide 4'-kinase [Desulfobacterales bacterium]